MWIIVGPKKDYNLTEFIVNTWSLHWEYQLQINFSIQRLWIKVVLGILWWVCYVNYFAMSCYVYILYNLLTYLWACNYFYFYYYSVFVASAANVSAQVNNIPMLNETNFKVWKKDIEIVLGCMDLDLTLRTKQPTSTLEASNEEKIEKWDRSNRMCIMIMKRSIPQKFRGSIFEGENAKKFIDEIEQYFAKNEKAETSSLLAKLISMKYKGKSNIREYIMEMSNLVSKHLS